MKRVNSAELRAVLLKATHTDHLSMTARIVMCVNYYFDLTSQLQICTWHTSIHKTFNCHRIVEYYFQIRMSTFMPKGSETMHKPKANHKLFAFLRKILRSTSKQWFLAKTKPFPRIFKQVRRWCCLLKHLRITSNPWKLLRCPSPVFLCVSVSLHGETPEQSHLT